MIANLATAASALWPLYLFLAALTVVGLWLCAASAGEHDYPDRSADDERAQADVDAWLDFPSCRWDERGQG